jgi:hypothetical protein
MSLIIIDGLIVVSLADTAAREQAAWAEPLFWLGLLLLYAPVAARLTSASISRTESLGLIALLGVALYVVKVLHSPLNFTHHDEFIHWRTVDDIVTTGRLFSPNPLLPISARYPALELVTAAAMSLTGLPPFEAGVLIVGLARLVFVVALWLVFEQVSGSVQIAGLATLIYMANPIFLFFNAMFKYETMALPLAALIVYLLLCRQRDPARSRVYTLAVGVLLLALVTTHHLTAFILSAFLGLWTLTAWYTRRGATERGPSDMFVLSLALNIVWAILFADMLTSYIGPLLTRAATSVVQMLSGDPGARRELFVGDKGSNPLWERVVGLASAGLIVAGLPFGLLEIWRRYRDNALAVALGVAAVGYPASLALRLSGGSWEVGYRTAEFLFVAVGFVVALGVAAGLNGRWHGIRGLLFVVAASVVFVGGIVNGWTSVWRLPGPYLPAQDTRSVEQQGIAAAEWTRDYLGPNNIIGADRTNGLLLTTYGNQYSTSTLNGGVNPGWALYAPRLDGEAVAT